MFEFFHSLAQACWAWLCDKAADALADDADL